MLRSIANDLLTRLSVKTFFVDCKSNLPTSRLARKRLATKGFGAGGVSLTPPVNLPCCPSSVHPKSVIRNRIAHSRDGLHCPSASRKLPLETTHSWFEFVSPEHEKAREVTREVRREVTREVWREVGICLNLWHTTFYEVSREVFCKIICQPIAGLRGTDGTDELFWRQTGQTGQKEKRIKGGTQARLRPQSEQVTAEGIIEIWMQNTFPYYELLLLLFLFLNWKTNK